MLGNIFIIEDGEWSVTVVTSDVNNAGTHANVMLTAYGDRGQSERLPLVNSDSAAFEQGKESQFKVSFDF